VQAKAFAGLLGAEDVAGGAVEGEEGFELGAGAGELDGGDAVAEVEAFGEDGGAVLVAGFGRGKQAAEAAADVGCAGEIGLGGGVVAAEGEDAGSGGDAAQDFGGVFGEEVDAMVEVEGRGHRRDCKPPADGGRILRAWK
jgi:hypothetical protein